VKRGEREKEERSFISPISPSYLNHGV
jgi:hypothetical protein